MDWLYIMNSMNINQGRDRFLFRLMFIADLGRFVASYHTRVNFRRPLTSVNSEVGHCGIFFAFLVSGIC